MDTLDLHRAMTSTKYLNTYLEITEVETNNKRTLCFDYAKREFVVLEKRQGAKFPFEILRTDDLDRAFDKWVGTRQMTIEEATQRSQEVVRSWKQEQTEKESEGNEHVIYAREEDGRTGTGIVGLDGNIYDDRTGELIGSATDGSVTIGTISRLSEAAPAPAGDEAESD